MNFTQSIPFTGNHISNVIGKKGETIIKLQKETGCFIEVKKAEPENGRPMPFIIIQGKNDKEVNTATIHVQVLLMKSMMLKESEYLYKIGELGQQNQFLELKKLYIETENNIGI